MSKLGIVNNLMIDLDEYLKAGIKKVYKEGNLPFHSYLWKSDIENLERCFKVNCFDFANIAFRHPGSTNGHIVVDKDMIIKDIVFYEDTCWRFYEGDYQSLRNKYIGTKLSVEEIEEE